MNVVGRFDRQLGVPGFGVAAQRRLRRATAVVAGIGGVGGAAATYLAAAGVGRLVLLRPGPLEPSDLNRQTLMSPDWVGRPRCACAAATLARHFPDVEVITLDEPVGRRAGTAHLGDADVAIDARHNFAERFRFNRLCVQTGVPFVEAAMDAAEGRLTVVRPGSTPCLACLFPTGDPAWDPLGFPVLGAVAGTVGCLAGLEAIKVATGWGEPLEGRMLALDLAAASFRVIRVRRDPGCLVCGQRSGGWDDTATVTASSA